MVQFTCSGLAHVQHQLQVPQRVLGWASCKNPAAHGVAGAELVLGAVLPSARQGPQALLMSLAWTELDGGCSRAGAGAPCGVGAQSKQGCSGALGAVLGPQYKRDVDALE